VLLPGLRGAPLCGAFQAAPPELACLQAPLVITNAGDGLFPRLFAVEYAALFRALLPWLAARRLVLPLGGTSNHFRRSALDKVGGWDPYNVTEDADLGIRLVRCGYRSATLTRPTLEDAPPSLRVWLPQRTRWLKGYLQTWLVHMRDPARLWRDAGPASFLLVQVLLLGVLLSALIHPMLVATLLSFAASLARMGTLGGLPRLLLALDVVNLVCGYASFLLLGRHALRVSERGGFWLTIAFTPIYWLMVSLASWCAVKDLLLRPHHWDKTPHFRRRPLRSPPPPELRGAP